MPQSVKTACTVLVAPLLSRITISPSNRTVCASMAAYAKAKAALDELGQQGIIVLRHLENHRILKVNGLNPPVPEGNECTRHESDSRYLRGPRQGFSYAPFSRPSGGVAPILE